MKVKEIVSALERFAPLPLQDGFDNAGLQVGLTEAEATGNAAARISDALAVLPFTSTTIGT